MFVECLMTDSFCAHCCVLSTIGNSDFSTILCATILLNNELMEVTRTRRVCGIARGPSPAALRLPHTFSLSHSVTSLTCLHGLDVRTVVVGGGRHPGLLAGL